MRGTIGAGNERPYWKKEKTGRRNDTRLPETDNACFRIELMLRTLFLARLLCFTPSPCPSPPSEYDFDLIIVGAGPVGLAVARGLAQRSATRALSVALIDQHGATPIDDPRTLALSHGSRMLLEPLGWPAATTPIKGIHVSQRGHF